MAKKFGKFLLFVTATCAVAAGVYYFIKKKETADWDDEDFDDFDEEEEDDFDDIDSDFEERNYVPLNVVAPVEKAETTIKKETKDPTFTEEYFDDEDEYVDDADSQEEE